RCTTTLLLLSITIPALLSIGCSSSKVQISRYMTSFPDPDFLGKNYNQLAVYYNSSSLYERQYVETCLVEQLRERGVTALPSSTIIPPTRQWDSARIHEAMVNARIDGYLHIVEIERSVDSTWVPVEEISQTKKEGEEKKVPGKKSNEEKQDTVIRYTEVETTTTSTRGGYWQTSLWRGFRVELIDLPSNRIAWLGTTGFWGNIDYGGAKASERIAGQLGIDGMILTRSKHH
ncbi:MAG: hypothetical protein AB7H80_11520, partial [Candidatus Kapaibacterium sp.]